MGGTTFETVRHGKTPDEAFAKAVEDAQYEYGHGGYTGTIAEKAGYVRFALPARMTFAKFQRMIADASWSGTEKQRERAKQRLAERIALRTDRQYTVDHLLETYDDKWGPAVCVELGPAETAAYRKRFRSRPTHGVSTNGGPTEYHYPPWPRGTKVYAFMGWAST